MSAFKCTETALCEPTEAPSVGWGQAFQATSKGFGPLLYLLLGSTHQETYNKHPKTCTRGTVTGLPSASIAAKTETQNPTHNKNDGILNKGSLRLLKTPPSIPQHSPRFPRTPWVRLRAPQQLRLAGPRRLPLSSFWT